jgi:hypothetical protein
MAIRRTLAALILGSALVAHPAVAQAGGSVSLTHTVSVSVPPRVKVQVGAVTPALQSRVAASPTHRDALAISVSATQSWILSIGSVTSSQLEWSTDVTSGFASVTNHDATIASGEISQRPAAAILYFRGAGAAKVRESSGVESSDAVILTMVAP